MQTVHAVKGRPGRGIPGVVSRIDLPLPLREGMSVLLNRCLADAIDLQLQCKHAHWNVKGMSFYTLHKLFDEVHVAMIEYSDTLAERVAQLGGRAMGTIRAVGAATRLDDYPASAVQGEAHIAALSSSLSAFGKSVREAAGEAEEAGDRGTADLFTTVSQGVDQWLWFMDAHLGESREKNGSKASEGMHEPL